jgi:hypothetical protein
MASTDPGPGFQTGDTAVPSTVAPTGVGAPVVRASDLLGSHRTVDTLVDRDAIGTNYRDEGMTVWVTATAELYRLVGGITNGDWALEAAVASGDVIYTVTYNPGVLVRDVVYVTGSSTLERADASAIATGRCLGVVAALDFPAAGVALVKRVGKVIGFAGLTPGAFYVQSTTPGLILPEGSVNPAFPSATGEVVQVIGQALNASELLVDCSSPVVELP